MVIIMNDKIIGKKNTSNRCYLKINKPLRGYKPGIKIPIVIDSDTGSPIDPYWRRRLEDAKKDNCVELVKKR